MKRETGLARLASETFDVLVVGGGATGLGTAVDAASRGFRTGLIEAEDFAKATSSRSTKLIHGGVRYLQQGDVRLVREALRERTLLQANAPHIVHQRAFVVPAYRWFEMPYYAAGLQAYDLLAGRTAWPKSRVVSKARARALFPALRERGLRGAVVYVDGQFDDARLAVTLARTAVDAGAAIANYVRATRFLYENGRICGVTAGDCESKEEFAISARVVINATGIFVDALRALDDQRAPILVKASRGTHIVVRAEVLALADAALLVPRTVDKRVLFAVPWHDYVLIGTTDIPVGGPEVDPQPTEEEVSYILSTVNGYLARPLREDEIVATFAGLRPLLNRGAATTAKLSREHLVDVGTSGLVTVAGGKWTTYRKMAEDTVDVAQRVAGFGPVPSATSHLRLHGATEAHAETNALRVYGTDAGALEKLTRGEPALGERLHPRLPYTGAEVVYAAQTEMARTVEDVLARRTRALFLDEVAAHEAAPRVASLLARELGCDATWEQEQLANFARRRAQLRIA